MPASWRVQSFVLLGVTVALLALGASLALAASGLPPARREGLVARSPGFAWTQGEWARRLAETLDLAADLPRPLSEQVAFDRLCPERMDGRIAGLPEPIPLERVSSRAGAVRWQGPSARPGRYRLTVYGRGTSTWATAGSALSVLSPGDLAVDVSRQPLLLAGGPVELRARPADGARVDRVEVTPWATSCIAPAGGWRAGRSLTFGAKARTMLLALDALERLPREEEPLRVEAERFALAARDMAVTRRVLGAPASQARWVEAIGNAAEFRYAFELEEAGLFTILARIHGAGRQVWSLDGALHTAVVAGEDAPRFAWSEVATVWLEAGSHALRALLPRGAGIDVVQLLRRRTDDEAFLEALGSLGLREGAAADVVGEAAARGNLEALDRLLQVQSRDTSGLAAAEGELEQLYRRPLSPVLPGDL